VSPHRTPGEVVPDGLAAMPKGPALKCPACGIEAIARVQAGFTRGGKNVDATLGRSEDSPLPMPRACTWTKRVPVGTRKAPIAKRFLWFWTRTIFVDEVVKCTEPGEHLHERCKVCGLEWLTAFAEGAQ
jgi:hypothetical protein